MYTLFLIALVWLCVDHVHDDYKVIKVWKEWDDFVEWMNRRANDKFDLG